MNKELLSEARKHTAGFIKDRRKELKMTHPEVAKICGMKWQTIFKIENQLFSPNKDLILKINYHLKYYDKMQQEISKKIDSLKQKIAIYVQAIEENADLTDHYTVEMNLIDETIIDLQFSGATLIEVKFQKDLLQERINWLKDFTGKRQELAQERAIIEMLILENKISILENKINKLLVL